MSNNGEMIPAFQTLIYDGRCGLCHRAVKYILKRDRRKNIRFAANSSRTGLRLLSELNLPTDPPPESMIFVRHGRATMKSSAAIEIARELGGLHRLVLPAALLPAFIRDKVYDMVARRRYRFFGRFDQCRLPSVAERARFLDADEITP